MRDDLDIQWQFFISFYLLAEFPVDSDVYGRGPGITGKTVCGGLMQVWASMQEQLGKQD